MEATGFVELAIGENILEELAEMSIKIIFSIICIIAFIIIRVAWKIVFGMITEKAEWGECQTMICPNCGYEFPVSYKKLYSSRFVKKDEFVLNINDRNKRVLRCPSCRKTELCVMKDNR